MIATECYKERGYYPISFSYPKNPYLYLKDKLVADIVPGNRSTYAFDNETDYLKEYERSYYGITSKKAGWDCFRHLEIMVSGAIPLMSDSSLIPKYTMTHHLKDLYVNIYDRFQRTNEAPSVEERQLISANFINNLTCRAMTKYILNMAGIEPKRVLFIDKSLPEKEDYLSMLTLIGLKQIFGKNCVEAFITPYLYDSYTLDPKGLYGLGFGYSRILPAKDISGLKTLEDIKDFDLVVIGDLRKNRDLIDTVEKSGVPFVSIYTEDFAPHELGHEQLIHNTSGITFVREIH